MNMKEKQMKQNNKDNKRRKSMGIILIYVAFSVTGLLLLKIGTTRAFNLSFSNGNFEFSVNSILLIGTVLSLIAMKTIDLSIFYPISAGLGYVLVCILSYVVLKETIAKEQLIGIVFILVGVILMNLKK